MMLVIDGQGGRVDSDCASGWFHGPVTALPDGQFTARGSFDQHAPGPQAADTTAPALGARYDGELRGELLTLTITPDGGREPQTYTLQAGARIKLIRCL